MHFGTEKPENQILNLKKNDILDLTKVSKKLHNVILGAGWDVASKGPSFDLDIAAFLLHEDNQVKDPSREVVFFNQMKQQGIRLEGDNLTGEGEGDDERIDIDLKAIDPEIKKIVFIVTIFKAEEKRQTFGMINNSYVRLLDADDNEKELCRFSLKEEASSATAVIFAELSRIRKDDWEFKALGEGKVGDLNDIITLYM